MSVGVSDLCICRWKSGAESLLVCITNKHVNKLRCEQHTDHRRCDIRIYQWHEVGQTYPFKIEYIQFTFCLVLCVGSKLYLLLQIRVTELVFITLEGGKKSSCNFFFSEKVSSNLTRSTKWWQFFFCWGYLAFDKGFYHSYTQFPSFFSVAKNFSDEQKCNSKTNTKRNIIKHKSFAIKCLHWFW